LGVAVYDTQCGAKVFRVNANLAAAIDHPFRSSWSFDVLLCQRLFDGTAEVPGLPISSFLEMPLDEWSDIPGSKLKATAGAQALIEVLGMAFTRRRDRRPATRAAPNVDSGSHLLTQPGADLRNDQ
jgi:dolichyl-phosphate beta-glucosyltransferase